MAATDDMTANAVGRQAFGGRRTGAPGLRGLIWLVLAVDAGTVLAFAALHQVFIAWTPGPLMAIFFGIPPAAAVVWAWTVWGRARPAAWKLGVGAAACGILPWLAAQAFLWDGANTTNQVAVSIGASVAAGVLAALAAYFMTRRLHPAAASGVAVLLAFGFTAPFLAADPVTWVTLRALLCLGASVVAGAIGLGWAARRLARRPSASEVGA